MLWPDIMTPEQVREALKHVIDPELGVNIVDLGLVYDIGIDGGRIRITMTMTSPACPLGSYLTDLVKDDVQMRVRGVEAVDVAIVWEPRWHPGMMSNEAKAFLGWSDPESAVEGVTTEGDR